MKNLHPIAAKLGYQTNEDFYNDYPTKESYEMAMGGSPYVGQPTYDQFLSFGPPTKQVPFYDYGGNVDLFLKETKKSLMPAARTGMETKGTIPTSTNDFLDQRNNYTLGFIKDNFQRGLVNEIDNEVRQEFMRYGGLPKAQPGIDMSFQKFANQGISDYKKNVSGKFTREIEDPSLLAQNPDLMLFGASAAANFFNAPERAAAEKAMQTKTLGDYVFPKKPGGDRGNSGDGAMLSSNFRSNDQVPVQFRGQGLYSGEYGGSPSYADQFGGMIQYDSTGSQTLPVALSGLQVKMNPGLGNSTYNSNQLAWPFHPDTMSAPPVRSRRNLTSVPRENANVEAEGGETVVTNFSGDAIPEHYNIKGPRHTNGGVPLNLPEQSFIFSDTAKMRIKDPEILKQFGMAPKKGGYTPAQIAKKYDINKYKKILMDPDSDETQISTAEKMIADCNIKLAKLALIQESMKGFPQGIPEIAKPYLAQLNIDPNMFFGEEQPEAQVEETEEMPEQEGMETQPDEEMEYGGIPQAKYGLFDNPYYQRAMYNMMPLNYNRSYGYPEIPRIPGAGREYSFTSNSPEIKSAEFLKGVNPRNLKINQVNPSGLGKLFKPRKTTIEMEFGPYSGNQSTNQPGTQTSTTPNTQANATPGTQTNTAPGSSGKSNLRAIRDGDTTPQGKILDPNNPTGPYHSQGKKKYYNPQGVGVNEGVYNQSQDTRIPGFTTPGRSSMDQTYGDYEQAPFNKPFMQPKSRAAAMNDYSQAPFRNTNTPPYGSYEYGGIPIAQDGIIYSVNRNGKVSQRSAQKGELSESQRSLRSRQPAPPPTNAALYNNLELEQSPAGDYGLAGYDPTLLRQFGRDVKKLIPYWGTPEEGTEDVGMMNWVNTFFDLPQKTATAMTTGVYGKPGNIYEQQVVPRYKERDLVSESYKPTIMKPLLNFAADPLWLAGPTGTLIKTGALSVNIAKDIAKATGLGYGLVANVIKKYGPQAYAHLKSMVKNPAAIDRILFAAQKSMPDEKSRSSKKDDIMKLYDVEAPADSTKVAKPIIPQEVRDTVEDLSDLNMTQKEIQDMVKEGHVFKVNGKIYGK